MDFSKELIQLQELLYFKMNMLQAEIEMNAMIAENKQREILGQSMAYNEKNFTDLIEEYNIHHNAFPFYKG
jgi:hypothetical protein